VERLETLAEQASEALDTLHHMQALDAQRLQTLLSLIRDMLAEYDQDFAKTR
jgi:hypothetical protein